MARTNTAMTAEVACALPETCGAENKKAPAFPRGLFRIDHRVEEISVFGRPGSDLLFQALRLSIIGAGEFNGRVRDGIGFRLPASTTRSAKDGNQTRIQKPYGPCMSVREASWNFTRATRRRGDARSAISILVSALMRIEDKSDQASRAIRTGKLNTLRCLHTRPINVVVYHGSV